MRKCHVDGCDSEACENSRFCASCEERTGEFRLIYGEKRKCEIKGCENEATAIRFGVGDICMRCLKIIGIKDVLPFESIWELEDELASQKEEPE